MPEGDAVLRTARKLERALSGQVLTETDFRVPQLATVDLAGGLVVETIPRGKHILTRIDAERSWTLHTHLGMDGSWRDYAPTQRWTAAASKARVVLRTERRVAVGFALKTVELLATESVTDAFAYLGPDLLGPDWDAQEAASRVEQHPETPIHSALLDQRNLAGLGNMFVAELCFLRGLSPFTPVSRAGDLLATVRLGQRLLSANVDTRSATGSTRPGQEWWVYRRDRKPCRRCQTPIRVAMSGPGGLERAVYWCPSCQPER